MHIHKCFEEHVFEENVLKETKVLLKVSYEFQKSFKEILKMSKLFQG